MSGEIIVVLIVVGWIAFGPALSLVMGRRGHSAAAWGVTGMFLGPLAVPVALSAARRHHETTVAVLTEGAVGAGPLSVLAAIDGSDEARAALARAVSVLGDRMGRLTLVHVASVDAADDAVLMEREANEARQWMAAARQALGGHTATECVVAGPPAPTLARIAAEDGDDLLVVGSRGRGMSPRLLGSVVQALAGSSPVPVLIGGAQTRRGTPSPGQAADPVDIDLASH